MAGEAYALVTGASSGFGVDFARDLAARGYDLILVARREDKLRDLASEIEREFSRRAEVIVADLSDDAERERVCAAALALGKPVEVLVNNAGLGLYGRSSDIPWNKEHMMLGVDVVAVAHLTKVFAKAMVAEGNGYILNVASTGAYQPTPLYATYCAAKAFVLSYSQAVNFELRGTGVSLTCVSPGIAATEFLSVSKQEPTFYQKMTIMQSKVVVAKALKALFARRATIIPGPLNNLMTLSETFVPASLKTRMAFALMRSNEAVH